jgi:glyoxylate reductase
LLLAVARRVAEADKYVRAGQWKVGWHPNMMAGRDIYGTTIGVVGAGRIGYAVAKRATGFDMKILFYDVVPRPEMEKLGATKADVDTLLKQSDFVSIHVPLMKQTQHLINEQRLKLMKKTAYLINNSRGPVVDEKALCKALKEGWIAGAGLDVFEQEPIPVDSPLLKMDNVVLAPHISSASLETRSRMAEMVADNLVAFFEGKKPPNLVNPDAMKIRPLKKQF